VGHSVQRTGTRDVGDDADVIYERQWLALIRWVESLGVYPLGEQGIYPQEQHARTGPRRYYHGDTCKGLTKRDLAISRRSSDYHQHNGYVCVQGGSFIAQLLDPDLKPILSDRELIRLEAGHIEALRAELARPLCLTKPTADAAVGLLRRKLRVLAVYNKNMQLATVCHTDGGGESAQSIVLGYSNRLDELTVCIDTLAEALDDGCDSALALAREHTCRLASKLEKTLETVVDPVGQAGMLSGQRRDELASLAEALSYIAASMRSTRANNWGYRITSDCAPPDVVQKFEQHWLVVRHMAAKLRQWAKVLKTVQPAPNHHQPPGKSLIPRGSMRWQEAQIQAEKHVRAHEGAFPSVKRLAEIVGCSRPTMDKAIKAGSIPKRNTG